MDIATAITDLVLETFRLNGALLASGDALIADLGLTSARWQVLGAIAYAPQPLPVAHIARNMGLTRQAVQRLVNEMAADGLLDMAPNPHHRRAKLVILTAAGHAVFEAAMARQKPWAEALGRDLTAADIDGARRVLAALRSRLLLDDNTTEGESDGMEEHV
ncbi:MarR family winged helix-turn-helix transcriptional regulator [Mongoliimonas terrestris]|uniref:MarR family winged helix-turn-helix transcriptional regulator n=1 Tax=Mongoliimonas terrestris TaxID=1709001 RepID=UPI001FDAA352|nr:MarR family transcriptional regulator [Mongoliimonas terrestris]